MLKKVLVSLLLTILMNLTLVGSTLAQAPETDTLNFEDYTLDLVNYTLPNGLRVILAEDHSAPVVAVDIWYRVGGANDPENRSGFAHLFEHMMFRGSANVDDGEYGVLLEAIGASNNAYTTSDYTAYWTVAPANQLPLVLWLESDRMASLAVTQESFETERDVVIEEFNQRVANNPYGASNQRLFTQPMQGYPPYERAVIGNVKNLQEAKLKEVQAFFDTYYKPNNATLVIVGDIDIELTKILIQAYFGDISAGDEVIPILARHPLPKTFPVLRSDPVTGCKIGIEETYIDELVELPRFTATVVAPPRNTPDFYALSLLVDILGSGDSSRFEQNIVRQGLAANAFVGLRDYQGASVLFAGGFPNSGDTVEAVQDLVRAEFEDVMANGVTEAELARVKKQLKVGTITSFRESVRSTAEWFQDAALTFDDPNAIADELVQYEAVTLDDVQRVAQTYLCDKPMNILITLPEGKEVLVEAEDISKTVPEAVEIELTDKLLADLPEGIISRTEAPTSLPVSESKFPPFRTFTLDNGLEVIFVEQHEVPKLRLELFVGGSNPAMPADKQGVADFVAELLTKGTTTRSAAQIAEEIESAGGSVGSDTAIEWTSLSVEALSTDAQLVFDLLEDMARHSTFPQKEFEVVKEQVLTFLEQDAVNPDSLADHQFARIAYGNHPYGFYMTQETVKNLTRKDVVEFYDTFFKPNNALLVIVGDITAREARAQTERVFDDWESGEVPDFLDYPKAKLGDTSVIYLVDRPESGQATIQIGNRGINARNPDRYALIVVNAVLGTGSSSRLYTNLRSDKGYTYDIYSRFGRPNDTSTFRVITDVDQDQTANAIREILQELKKIRTQEITDQELQDAKGLLIGSFALAIEEPANFALQLATRRLTGVSIEELNTYLQKLEQVTVGEALAAAAEYIDSEQPIIVIVGDAKVLKPQLEKLGEVIVVDGDGKVIE